MLTRVVSKLRAVAGLTATQLVHYRLPSLLAVLGVAVAVLLMVLLSGMGYGVTTAGSEGLAWLEQDLWISGGALEISPGVVGGIKNPILDSHQTVEQIKARDDVESAGSMLFQAVYVSQDGEDFDTLVGVGVSGNSTMVRRQAFGFSSGDVHYANGTYSGPLTHEVVIDERTAARYNISTGDTLYIGGTLRMAREHEFDVVGVRSTFGTFLGTATVTLHQSELQTLTGSTASDPASLITVAVEPNADTAAVKNELQREYPSYAIRTNREQLEAVFGQQSSVLASAGALVAIAIVIGLALVVNVLGLLVYHQRRELLALNAAGVSRGTLVAVMGSQGVAIGLLGGAVGLGTAPMVARMLNPVIEQLSGFAELIKLPWWILGAGGGLAMTIGIVGAMVAGWRISRLRATEELRQ